MIKNIVVYYSKTGSNKFLAEKTAEVLNCEAIQLKPRVSPFLLLILASATKLSFGNKALKTDFGEYEQVTLCGPIWMGMVVAPLNDFIKKYKGSIIKLNFITCCGSSDEGKNDKFGYALVFEKLKELVGAACGNCEAFSLDLLLSDAERDDDEAKMKTRLSESNFPGEIKTRFDEFIKTII